MMGNHPDDKESAVVASRIVLHECIDNEPLDSGSEALVAKLTSAAYEVALRHGIKGAFSDLELALWRQLREVVASIPSVERCLAETAE